LTLQGKSSDELLPPITPYFVMKVGHVPVIPYHRPGDPDAALLVGATIQRYIAQGTPIRALMLARLGPNVWHDTPASAMAVLEELEETARLVCLNPTPASHLNPHQLQELRDTLGARW
jgi:ribulose-5-phosphate 4-epimerase/fuculose-1-phosphate aldolase